MFEQIEFITCFLKRNSYPKVDLMSNEEMLQVFNAINRVFLVSWALNKLNSQLFGHLMKQEPQDIKNAIVSVISTHGFCDNIQAINFIAGQLPNPDEIQIIYRMFKHIDCLQKATKLDFDVNEVQSVVSEEIKGLEKFNKNFFPYLDANESSQQLDLSSKFTDCFEKVKNNLELNSPSQLMDLPSSDLMQLNIQSFHKYLRLFKQIVSELVQRENSNSFNQFHLDPSLPNDLIKIIEDLNVVTQLTENLNINTSGLQSVQISEDKSSSLISGLTEYIDLLG